jgi:hypothetical protein
MGFSEESAKGALIRFHNNLDVAMNHLLENGGTLSENDLV